MDFLNHREGGKVFYQVFLLSPLQCTVTNCTNCKRLREFEETEISRQSCRGDCEQQRGKLLGLFSGFRPRIRPLDKKEKQFFNQNPQFQPIFDIELQNIMQVFIANIPRWLIFMVLDIQYFPKLSSIGGFKNTY